MEKKIDNWFERFVQLIKNDSRSMDDISKQAHCGQNYVQQMIKYNKRPSVDKFLAILKVLGDASAIYVLTGFEVKEQDLRLINILNEADETRREAILTLLDTAMKQ